MKTALITTAAALLLTSVWSASSFAQHYDDEDHGGHHYRGDYDRQSGRYDEEDRDRGWERDRSRDMGSMMRQRPHMGLMGRAMMFSRGGARFQFSKGDAHIDIRCPQNETLQNCVDAASRLIDKVHSLEPGSSDQGAAQAWLSARRTRISSAAGSTRRSSTTLPGSPNM